VIAPRSRGFEANPPVPESRCHARAQASRPSSPRLRYAVTCLTGPRDAGHASAARGLTPEMAGREFQPRGAVPVPFQLDWPTQHTRALPSKDADRGGPACRNKLERHWSNRRLFVFERHERIDFQRPLRWDIAGCKGDGEHDNAGRRQCGRVPGTDSVKKAGH